MAALCLPALLARCGGVLRNYVADSNLRRNVPFPRYTLICCGIFMSYYYYYSRYTEEELLYTLRKLLEIRLWPGTLWAAFQEQPSLVAVEQPRKFKKKSHSFWACC